MNPNIAADLAALEAEVERNTTVDGSAILLLNGFAAKVEAAVAAALANGATEAELAPIRAAVAAFKTSSDALAAAVAANTLGVDANGQQVNAYGKRVDKNGNILP